MADSTQKRSTRKSAVESLPDNASAEQRRRAEHEDREAAQAEHRSEMIDRIGEKMVTVDDPGLKTAMRYSGVMFHPGETYLPEGLAHSQGLTGKTEGLIPPSDESREAGAAERAQREADAKKAERSHSSQSSGASQSRGK
jgi:hypothetical protein